MLEKPSEIMQLSSEQEGLLVDVGSSWGVATTHALKTNMHCRVIAIDPSNDHTQYINRELSDFVTNDRLVTVTSEFPYIRLY